MEGMMSFAPSAGVLRQLRADVRTAAARLGAEAQVCDTVALVVDELVNNAVEHGAVYRRKGLDLAIRIAREGVRLSIEFFDQEMPDPTVRELAAALAEAANGMPSLESERGRGLFLLTIYLEDLRVEVASAGGLRLAGYLAKG